MLLGADEKWLATVPIFLAHLGIMGTTIPASLLMGTIGRRAGFLFAKPGPGVTHRQHDVAARAHRPTAGEPADPALGRDELEGV
jgi:hypothetical protein